MEIQKNFILGRMNKSVDERLVRQGEYVDAMNVRLGSTENTEIGSVENSKGNSQLTTLRYLGINLASTSKCIGVYEDGANETVYWFVKGFQGDDNSNIDMIVSFKTTDNTLTYHVLSKTVLNFNTKYLITGVNKIDDLLFFTDDYNPPRKINVTRSYPAPSVAGVDNIKAEDINVIVAPPKTAPTISLFKSSNPDNYIEDRFIAFAYRYKYKDGEYSALSQFTEPAFVPGTFRLDPATYENNGMENIYNTVNISFDTGGENVVGIDLCFKMTDETTINVIERYTKDDVGWADNKTQTITFDNGKIYTTLGSDELLRLYDNVPRYAQAQTMMGNRLFYGNYVDGYNLIDKNDEKVSLTYTTSLQEKDITISTPTSTLTNGSNYTIDGTVTTTDSQATIDLSGLTYTAGSILTINFTYIHSTWSGTSGGVSTGQAATDFTLTFTLSNSYNNTYDMASSTEFANALGTPSNIQTVANCALGTTLTDIFNCSVTNPTDSSADISWVKNDSGISGVGQSYSSALALITTPGSDEIKIQLLAMKYTDTNPAGGTAAPLYQYFKFTTTPDVNFLQDGSIKSLHSNRDYEVGIVYMDEYNRATTALVSQNNTVFVPARNSTRQNYIRAQLPITPLLLAPTWATKYKFVVKRSQATYETIYANIFYKDSRDNSVYFKLESNNQTMVKAGDRLVVKRDCNGPLGQLVTTVALDVSSQAAGFLTGITDSAGNAVEPLKGVYLQLKPRNFSAGNTADADYFIYNGREVVENPQESASAGVLIYPCYTSSTDGTGTTTFTNYDLPQGSRVKFTIVMERNRAERGSCAFVAYEFEKTFTASTDYDNLYDFVVGEGIDFTGGVTTGVQDGFGGVPVSNTFTSTIGNNTINPNNPVFVDNDNQYQFFSTDGTDAADKKLELRIRGGVGRCPGFLGWTEKTSTVSCEIEVVRAETTMVFETVPIDADVDLYYDGSKNYDIVNGYHTDGHTLLSGTATATTVNKLEDNTKSFPSIPNSATPFIAIGDTVFNTTDNTSAKITAIDSATVLSLDADIMVSGETYTILTASATDNQPQTSTQEGIINLDFFDCFTFGNGVESYKIFDSLTGHSFNLGERTTTVANQEYKEADRFAGITYSGVYNDESNINNLNEFNLSLANFKNLEKSFGSIEILHARETDILVLQEDKISYVLADKNLISDAAAGGAIVSTPTVLGTQIARTEEYGISHNAESFVAYGYNRYFTDAKRGAVLQLKGSSYNTDKLSVISEAGMRSWFRDLFNTNFYTQKLGGFDPYMNEYVLSNNEDAIPTPTVCIACDTEVSQNETTDSYVYCVDAGATTGLITVTYTIDSIDVGNTITVSTTYNGVAAGSSGAISASGSYTFSKSLSTVNQVDVAVTAPSAGGKASYTLKVSCPATNELTIIQLALNVPGESGQLIHDAFTFGSAYDETQIIFEADGISNYRTQTGTAGTGVFPLTGETITMISEKQAGDDFVFDSAKDKFKYLVSNTLYTDTDADINTLIPLLSTATPITNPSTGKYQASFTYTNATPDPYLYLVSDYREPTSVTLCYHVSDPVDVCCTCTSSSTYYLDSSTLATATAIYTDTNLTTLAADGYYATTPSPTSYRQQIAGALTSAVACTGCAVTCNTGNVTISTPSPGVYTMTVDFTGQSSGPVTVLFTPGSEPVALSITYNGTTYDTLAGPSVDLTAHPTGCVGDVVGLSGSTCTNAAAGTLTMNSYEYDSGSSTFVWDGATTESFTITDVDLQAGSLGVLKMVIPFDATVADKTMTVKMAAICPNSGASTSSPIFNIPCVVALTSATASVVQAVKADACAETNTSATTYHTTGASTPAVGDWVFSDSAGTTALAAGYYLYVYNRYMLVSSCGVVIETGYCVTPACADLFNDGPNPTSDFSWTDEDGNPQTTTVANGDTAYVCTTTLPTTSTGGTVVWPSTAPGCPTCPT